MTPPFQPFISVADMYSADRIIVNTDDIQTIGPARTAGSIIRFKSGGYKLTKASVTEIWKAMSI